jgi:hypothetical protein
MKDHDLPNWIVVGFSLFVWPLALRAWNRREVRFVPGLKLSLLKTTMKMDNKDCGAVEFQFLNNTGSVVFISNARLLQCTGLFKIHPGAYKDIVESSHELKFPDGTGTYSKRQVTLQTGESVKSLIAVESPIDDRMLSYRVPWYLSLLHSPKYFRLKYAVVVGEKQQRVSFNY